MNVFKATNKSLMTATMLSYISAFCALGMGYFNMHNLFLSLIVWQFMTLFGIAIGYHRYFSHSMFVCNRFWQWMMAITGMVALREPPCIAAHRHTLHHAYADTERDPLVRAIIDGPIKLRTLDKLDQKIISRMVRKDNLHRLTMKYYWLYVAAGVTILTIIGMLLGLSILESIFWLWLAPAGFSLLNGYYFVWSGHRTGYRNFKINDNSRNSMFRQIFLGGDGLDNNHHNDPRNPNNAVKWWEFDPSYLIIKMIRTK